MKKFLSIILAILMIVTMIPMAVLPASAAENLDYNIKLEVVDWAVYETSGELIGEFNAVKHGDAFYDVSLTQADDGTFTCSYQIALERNGGNTAWDESSISFKIDSCEDEFMQEFEKSFYSNYKIFYNLKVTRSAGHSFSDWADAGDGTHTRICSVCSETETQNHSFDGGNCLTVGKCDCGLSSIDSNVHTKPVKYVVNSENNFKHDEIYECCGVIKSNLDHKYDSKGMCKECKYQCAHSSLTDSICDNCGYECPHENITDGKCDNCGTEGTFVTIDMTDSYGDGWNGNAVVIKQFVDGVYTDTEAGTATIEYGAGGTFTTVLPKDGIFALSWLTGEFPSECSFTLTVDGETVYECADGSTLTDGQMIYVICEHTSYTDGICDVCGYECPHESYTDGKCDDCDYECPHENITDGKCDACGLEVTVVTITMTDSYGDGWNGNKIVIKQLVDGVFTEVETATIENGGSGTFTTVLSKDGIYAFSWVKGDYPDECSFTIAVDGETVYECADGSTLTDGQMIYVICEHTSYTDGICDACGYECPHESHTDGKCDSCGTEGKFVTIDMTDWYGDGWSGNGIVVKQLVDGAYTEVATATIEDGASETFTALLRQDGIYAFSWVYGVYPEECSFTIAVDGETVYECADGSTLTDGQMIYVTCEHTSYTDGKCNVCDYECPHENQTGSACEICGAELHVCSNYNNGFCPNCDAYEPAKLVNGVYEISNAGNLYWFADKVTNENAAYGSADAILTCDIRVNEGTMTEASTGARVWTPIGKHGFGVNIPYTGTFEGNGKTVSGLYFNDTSANFSVGLFSLVGEGGKVQNVGIADSYLCGSQNIGTVAGSNFGTVTGCYNTGIISGSGNSVGGVVGYNYGTATNCYNTGTVSCSSNHVGGVVGSNHGTVTDCHNTGTVSGSDTVGGVVGYNYGTATNCYNTGTVSGSNNVGGVVGENQDTVTGCYNTGTVSGTTSVGGVAGINWTAVTNCYNTGTVSGTTSVGGVAGTNWTAVTNCYNTGTVSGTTDVGGVVGYNISDAVTVTNCYFDSTVYTGDAIGGGSGTATDVEGKSTEQFASGEVAYLLSQGENGSIWGQTIGTDPAPVFSDAKVYYGYTSCGDTVAKYTNDETISAEKPDHAQKPTYTDNGNGTHSTVYPCCGTTVTEDHTGGTATCTEQAKCEHCGASYGEVNAHDWSNLDGVCANGCGAECPHEWSEGVLTRPIRITTTDWDDGYYTYTCGICGSTKQETAKRADYSVLDAILEDFIDAMYDTTLLDSIRNELEVIYFDNIKVLYGDYIESEQAEVDALVETMTQKLAEVEAGVADGSALKPDYTEGDALINGIIEQFYDKGITYVDEIIAEFDTLYNEYLAIWHKPETTKPQVDEIVEELKALKEKIDKGTEDGTLVKADYTEIDEAIAEIEQKFADENVTDEAKAELEEIKTQLEEMKADTNTSKADLAELEKALDEYEEELDKGIEDGTLVKFSGERVFLEFAEEAENKIDEKYGENAFYDFANENRDSFYNLYDKYFFRAASLEGGTMAENAENTEYIKGMVDELFGMAENCLAGTHNYGEGVLTRPVYDAVLGSKDGYYTYTCAVCGEEKKETVKSADYSAYEAVSEEINALLQSDDLTPEAKQAIYSAANECGLPSNDLMESEQNIVDSLVAELEKIVADAEEKIASGEYVKADYTSIDNDIYELEYKLENKMITDEGKSGFEEIKKQLNEMKADENTSAADVAELEKALSEYEAEIDKGIEDGTLVMVDGDKIAVESNKKFAEKLEAEGLTDEYEDFIYNQKATDEALAAEKEIIDFANSLEGTVAENAENIAKLNEMFDYLFASLENCLRGTHNFKDYEVTSPAKCEVNAIETRTCWFCGETDEREVEGTALEHSFTKYEETEAPKCGVAGKEVAYCDHGCGETDERETPALEHVFGKYTSNGDATCTADGTKTAFCIHGCGETDTVADEGSMIDHSDEDGDKLCDDCEAEIESVCSDCGRPAHEDTGVPMYICIIIMFIRLVVSFVRTLQGAVA